MSDINVEVLYFSSCPSYRTVPRGIEEIVKCKGLGINVTPARAESEEDANRLKFPGSLTVRVKRADIEPCVADFGLRCEVDGRFLGYPSREISIKTLLFPLCRQIVIGGSTDAF